MKKIVFSAFIILFMGWSYAQKTIQVIDMATYQAVANVLVSKSDKSVVFGKTNEKGEIEIIIRSTNFKFYSLFFIFDEFCNPDRGS